MKRKVASRKMKRRCEWCGSGFGKGDVYYHQRKVWRYYDGENEQIFGANYTLCPKCKYIEQDRQKRYEIFKQTCRHEKKEFIHEVWDYIPGEAVMEPQYDMCDLCGNILKGEQLIRLESLLERSKTSRDTLSPR